MLLNIAEDLKEYAKIKVAPGGNTVEGSSKKVKKEEEKVPTDYDKFKEMAEAQAFVKLDNTSIDDDVYDDEGDRASYLYMEL